jgi:serine/threonine protein kinase
MGEVWSGHHPIIEKKVAIKFLDAQLSAKEDVVARFEREARAVNKIRHKHIVDIFSLGKLPEGRPYLVMEFLEGRSLRALLRDTPIPPLSTTSRIMEQLCSALQAVHQAGYVHRDIKPENIFLVFDEGKLFVKLLDFGIAKDHNDQAQTRTGILLGTLSYMAPEQQRSQPVDARSDIYSLGILLYQMLVGYHPFRQKGIATEDLLYKQLHEMPTALREVSPHITPRLSALVERMMQKEASARPASCAEVSRELQDALREQPSSLLAPPVKREPLPDTKTLSDSVIEITAPPEEKTLPPATLQVPTAPAAFPVKAMAASFVVAMGLLLYWLLPSSRETEALSIIAPSTISVIAPSTAPSSTPTSAAVQIEINSTPSGAEVFLNDTFIGKTPLPWELSSQEQILLRVEKRGYQSREELVSPTQHKTINLSLKKLASTVTPKNPETPTEDPKKPKLFDPFAPPKK